MCLKDYKKVKPVQRVVMLRKKQFGKGCFDIGIQSFKLGNLDFKVCPGNYHDSYVNYIWQLFTQYENNLLPYEGTLGSQPAKVIEIFDIIQGLIHDYENKLKKMKRLKDQATKG